MAVTLSVDLQKKVAGAFAACRQAVWRWMG